MRRFLVLGLVLIGSSLYAQCPGGVCPIGQPQRIVYPTPVRSWLFGSHVVPGAVAAPPARRGVIATPIGGGVVDYQPANDPRGFVPPQATYSFRVFIR